MVPGRCATFAAAVLLAVGLLPSCSQTANITEVWTALDSEGLRRRNLFFTDTKEIYCVGKAGIGRDGVTIEAFVRQSRAFDFQKNDFVLVDRIAAYEEFSPERSQDPSIVDIAFKPADAAIESEIGTNDPPFPPGTYRCEMLLDGVLEGSATFDVEFPPCPPTEIIPGALCFGFYRIGDECPASGATGAPDPKCRCTLERGWECPR
jgi:hypothetical protein